MNDTKIASKAKAQLSNFMGKVFTHFSKPTKRGSSSRFGVFRNRMDWTKCQTRDTGRTS